MTKKEFMAELRQALSNNKVNNIDEIVADYDEHFAHALAQGKTEDEISKKLGSPDTIAKAYETESMITTIKDPKTPFKLSRALNVLCRLIVLAPFNFLVLCIPGTVLASLIVAGWSCVVALGSCSLAAIAVAFQAHLIALSVWLGVGAFSACLSFAGATVLGGFLMYVITKQFLLFSISYLQWNVKFILER